MTEKKEEISIGPAVGPDTHIALRRQGDEVREVLVRPLRDGTPIHEGTEIATMGNAREDANGATWRPLTSIYRHGPAQVATPSYRDGYDRIFGKKQKVGLA